MFFIHFGHPLSRGFVFLVRFWFLLTLFRGSVGLFHLFRLGFVAVVENSRGLPGTLHADNNWMQGQKTETEFEIWVGPQPGVQTWFNCITSLLRMGVVRVLPQR